MKKNENWDNIQAPEDFKALKAGAYICKIKAAKAETTQSGKEVLRLMFDIDQGEFTGYYEENFKRRFNANPEAKWQGIYSQLTEGNSERFFKGLITAIEKSNAGYAWNWDEKTLVGKIFLGVFGEEEYYKNDGSIGKSTKCRFIRSIDQIDTVTIPEIKRVEQSNGFDMKSFGTEVFPESDIPF